MAEVQSDVAASRSEVAALRRAVEGLGPVGERTAVLVEQVGQLEKDVSRVEMKFDKRWDRLEASQESSRKDSKTLRNLIIAAGLSVASTSLGTLLLTVLQAKP